MIPDNPSSSSSQIQQTALYLLARREHSQLELRRKLRERGYTLTDIESVLTELKQQGLQSDARFAESYINMRINRGYGPVRIALELHERGITEMLINEYLDETDSIWYEHARRVWQKKFRGIMPVDFKTRAKQMNFLQYRGFTQAQIKACYDV